MASVEFYGERFTVVDTPNEFALMEFADAAQGAEENALEAMAAIYGLLKDSIAADPAVEGSTVESEWQRFRKVARANRADSASLMPVVFAVFEQAAERPTGQPSDSSAGPETTPLRSVSPPVEEALARLSGRPDLQAALLKSRRSA